MLHLHACTLHVCSAMEARRGCQIPWNGVIDSCEPRCGCWELIFFGGGWARVDSVLNHQAILQLLDTHGFDKLR